MRVLYFIYLQCTTIQSDTWFATYINPVGNIVAVQFVHKCYCHILFEHCFFIRTETHVCY